MVKTQTKAHMPPDRRENWFALTPMQSALVFEGVGSDQPWVNVEQVVVAFNDTVLDEAELRTAWQSVAARHDALRLLLDWRASPPVQRCLPDMTPALSVIDCTDIPQAQRRARLDSFLTEDRSTSTELSAAPGWRVTLLRFDAGNSVMVWTIHHALVDGRSMARILGEVLTLIAGEAAPDAPLPQRSFAEFARGLPEHLEQEPAKAFFKDYLADLGDAGVLRLPPQVPPADTMDAPALLRKNRIEATLPCDLGGALAQQARHLDATLASIIQTAWGIVLARWGGGDDISFSTVRSGRHAMPGLAEAAGCFINTLPLRLRIAPDLTLRAAVASVRDATLALRKLEQTAPATVRHACGLDGRQPLFGSIVMFERAGLEGLVHRDWPAARAHPITLLEEGGAALSLSVYGDAEMRMVVEHDPRTVTDAQAALLLSHLHGLLDSIESAPPEARIGSLDMMDSAQVAQLLELGAPDTPLGPTGDCLVRTFQRTVRATPEATALTHAGLNETFSYAALEGWSNGIAAQLHASGIGAGDVVAIRLPRSTGFIAALLGVLKCGAAFVPVDPSYPQALQAHMLSDSGAKAVLSDNTDAVAPDLLILDPDLAQTQADALPLPELDTGALAYILYTSGSTGKPKGVQVTRGNLLAHIAAITAAFALRPEDRVLQFASLSFDVALEEVFPTLMTGATLILRNDEMVQSASMFLDMAAQLRITVANLPTAFWHVLTDHIGDKGAVIPPDLRLLIAGGEQAKTRSLAAWRAAAPDVRWLNGYGPTEATITATLFEPEADRDYAEVPVGRPTAHARAYLLAADHSLSPRGAVGELALGGPAVTAGYVGQPQMTAAAFIPDSFNGEGRIYLSGDRAHWRADRNLAFLGREDRQVKLRGFRIDLRQIERALEAEVTGLRALAAVLDADAPTARLVAWVTGTGLPDAADLALIPARILPVQMRPVIMKVDAFPRTAGGKIDMAALPRPQTEGTAGVSRTTIAAGTLSPEIAAIMAQLLGRQDVGPDQNFYDLGGHSLLMMELIGRLETLAGVRLGLADFYDNPTPRQLARLLRKGSTAPKHIIPIQPEGTRAPLFAVHILGANEEYFRPLGHYLGPDQPVLGVSITSLGKDMPTGVAYTASRYCEDITDAFPDGQINLIAVSLGSYMAFELAQQLHAAGRDVGMLAIIDAAGPSGRAEVSGLPRLTAHLRRARYLGRSYPKQIIQNRIYDFRIARAARTLQRAANRGEVLGPSTFALFDASNEAAVNDYIPQGIDVPLTIFRAESHFFDTEDGIKAGLGWADVAQQGFEVIDVPGGHLTMLQEPHVQTVAARLAARLKR